MTGVSWNFSLVWLLHFNCVCAPRCVSGQLNGAIFAFSLSRQKTTHPPHGNTRRNRSFCLWIVTFCRHITETDAEGKPTTLEPKLWNITQTPLYNISNCPLFHINLIKITKFLLWPPHNRQKTEKFCYFFTYVLCTFIRFHSMVLFYSARIRTAHRLTH